MFNSSLTYAIPDHLSGGVSCAKHISDIAAFQNAT